MPRTRVGNGFSGLGRLVIRHRKKVMLAWLLCFAAGGYSASQLTHRLSYDFSLPGQPAYQTGAKILSLYGNGGNIVPSVLTITVPKGQSITGDHSTLAAAFATAQRANPEVRIVDVENSNDPQFVTSDGRTTYAYIFTPPSSGLGVDPRFAATETSIAHSLAGDDVGLTGISSSVPGERPRDQVS